MIDRGYLQDWFRKHAPNEKLCIAVSGGGDSLALLRYMAVDLRMRNLSAVTVDHGLRPEAAAEAAFVGQVCEKLGVPHTTLRVAVADAGNLQANARSARYDAITKWAHDTGHHAVVLGHTRDDVAETFVMRLARGSGVYGLSAMTDKQTKDGLNWLRPLLNVARGTLRDYLEKAGQTWIDDPSNEDEQFERVRVRKALPDLAQIGLDVDRLAQTAQTIGRARDALEWMVDQAYSQCCTIVQGCVVVDMNQAREMPEEIQLRLCARIVQWIGGQSYPPRLEPLRRMWWSVNPVTLAGVQTFDQKQNRWFFREFAAVQDLVVSAFDVWDTRWVFSGDWPKQAEIRVAGDAGQKMLTQADINMPFEVRRSSPVLWLNDQVLAGPDDAELRSLPFEIHDPH